MSLVLVFIASLLTPVAQAGPSVEFVFQGQPDCVDLSFEGERTRLTSRCGSPLLVDQSVLPTSLIPPGTETEIRDLSAFTIGMDGTLYRVVAMLVEPEVGPVVAVAPEEDTASED